MRTERQMGHAIRYRTSDGALRFEEHATLDLALERAERLRNDEDAAEVRVYREVPVTFRTYYKAVVQDDPTAPEDSNPTASTTAPPPGAMPLTGPPRPPSDEPEATTPEPADDGDTKESDQRRASIFGRN